MAITQPVTTVGSSIDGDLVHMLLEEVPTRIPGSPSASIGSPAAGGVSDLDGHHPASHHRWVQYRWRPSAHVAGGGAHSDTRVTFRFYREPGSGCASAAVT